MKAGQAVRPLVALALVLLCLWAADRAARLGWASFQSLEARALFQRAMESREPMRAQPWNRAREGYVAALQWDPDNPVYHQELADLYLLRLARMPGDRGKMTPYYEIALRHYFKAAALRPTWPYSHAGIVTVKQQIGQIDADFKLAMAMASRYGPAEIAIQEQLISAGYQSWRALGEPERELIFGNLRRAHQARPKQTAALLARLKAHAPPCDQIPAELMRDLPDACARPGASVVTPDPAPLRKPARKGGT